MEKLNSSTDKKEPKGKAKKRSTKEKEQPTNHAKTKSNDIRKCPSCGANISSFSYKCPYCGTEFSNLEVAHSLKDFSEGLERITATGKSQRIASYITNYPVPNSKEDLLEFMILASSNIQSKKGTANSSNAANTIQKAWTIKVEQIYQKAKITIKNSNDMKDIEDIYNQVKQSDKQPLYMRLLDWKILLIVFFGLIFVTYFFFWLLTILLVILAVSLFCFYKWKGQKIELLKKYEVIIYIVCILLLVGAILCGVRACDKNANKDVNWKNYYSESVEKNDVEIDIQFEANILFNRYDVSILAYDQKETLPHGKDRTIHFQLPDGVHQITFKSADNDITNSINLVVKGKTKVTYKISCQIDRICNKLL